MTKRRTVLVTATGAAAGAALAACNSGGTSARWSAPGGAQPSDGSTSTTPAAEADITVTPAAGAQNVSPADGVTVSATAGTLQTMSVTSGSKTVAGSMDSDQKTWKSTGRLSYGATYTVTATLGGGASGTKTCTFTTVKPAKLVSATLQANAMAALKDGGVYGVGQPLIVAFGKAPADRDAAVKALDVTI